jgi:hypothetical protein
MSEKNKDPFRMERLNIAELEDPMKLVVALRNEMIALADSVRGNRFPESCERIDRCLMLSGMASGTILRMLREEQ